MSITPATDTRLSEVRMVWGRYAGVQPPGCGRWVLKIWSGPAALTGQPSNTAFDGDVVNTGAGYLHPTVIQACGAAMPSGPYGSMLHELSFDLTSLNIVLHGGEGYLLCITADDGGCSSNAGNQIVMPTSPVPGPPDTFYTSGGGTIIAWPMIYDASAVPTNRWAYKITGTRVCGTCRADFNCSGGQPTVQDIFDFLAGYFGNDPRADINDSGAISVQDIFDFLAAYFAGCN